MTYEVIMLYHLHMPLCFLGTFTEYPFFFLTVELEGNSHHFY